MSGGLPLSPIGLSCSQKAFLLLWDVGPAASDGGDLGLYRPYSIPEGGVFQAFCLVTTDLISGL